MEEVQPTLGNTRRISFAIAWKLFALLWIGPFLLGFADYIIPFGQLQFWLLTLISDVFGSAVAEYLFRSPRAMELALVTMFNVFELLLVVVLLNWLLARHIGRTFGGFRLVLQRVP